MYESIYESFRSRLCSFSRSYNESESNDTMEKILQGVKSSYMFDLFLEIKPSYASFVTYKPGGTTVKVHLVDLDDQVVHAAVNVRAQLSNSVEEFKGLNKVSISYSITFIPRENTLSQRHRTVSLYRLYCSF